MVHRWIALRLKPFVKSESGLASISRRRFFAALVVAIFLVIAFTGLVHHLNDLGPLGVDEVNSSARKRLAASRGGVVLAARRHRQQTVSMSSSSWFSLVRLLLATGNRLSSAPKA
jgi:hypothetical protein